jgi:hypothetical protein
MVFLVVLAGTAKGEGVTVPATKGQSETCMFGINPRSPLFHGNVVGLVGYACCKTCHGSNLQGGSGPTCGKPGCHAFGSGYIFFPHQPYWTDISSPGFHGRFVLQRETHICQDCHGKDYRGGFCRVTCYACHQSVPHPTAVKAAFQDYDHGNGVYR